MPIQNTLPDPNNRISASGGDDSGSYGPGFSAVTVTSQQPIVMNRANSGLTFKSINKYQKFMVDIKYNKLTKAEFNVVYAFLLQRQASLESFFVELPQYGNTSAGSKTITVGNSDIRRRKRRAYFKQRNLSCSCRYVSYYGSSRRHSCKNLQNNKNFRKYSNNYSSFAEKTRLYTFGHKTS